MTLTQLTAFLSSARQLSFTRAAEELSMSQPAVSDLIRRLEHELGAELFQRSARGLVLTEAGEQLLPHAEQAVISATSGARAVRGSLELSSGIATFGLLRNADFYLGSDLALTFHTRYPSVRIRLVGQNSAETAADVAAGVLDAGLIALPVAESGLDIVPLARDEILCATAREPTDQAVTIEEFADRPLVLYDAHHADTDPARRQLHDRAQLAGRSLEPLVEVEYLSSALSLVAAGVGDTIVCRAGAASGILPAGVHTRPFAEPLYDTLALVKRRGVTLAPASREFARIAWETLRRYPSTAEFVHDPERLQAFFGEG